MLTKLVPTFLAALICMDECLNLFLFLFLVVRDMLYDEFKFNVEGLPGEKKEIGNNWNQRWGCRQCRGNGAEWQKRKGKEKKKKEGGKGPTI